MSDGARKAVREDEASSGGLSVARARHHALTVAAAAVVLLGGGSGAGYYLHGAVAPPPTTSAPTSSGEQVKQLERLASLEQWRAAQTALEERNREDRLQLVAAIRDANRTNDALRQAVIGLTEGLAYTRKTVEGMDARLRLVEVNQGRH